MDYLGTRWLTWGMGLFISSGVIWVAILIPVQIKQAHLAREFATSGNIPERYWFLGKLWIWFGTAATLLPLNNIYWMVFKPASTSTTRGRFVSRDHDTHHLAFCWTENISAPELVLRRSIPRLRIPLSNLRLQPHDRTRMIRGRCVSLWLHRDGLAPVGNPRMASAAARLVTLL
jgi:Predicted integral membrane protein (DUF2269)